VKEDLYSTESRSNIMNMSIRLLCVFCVIWMYN